MATDPVDREIVEAVGEGAGIKYALKHDAVAFGIPEDQNGARCRGLTVREYFAIHLMAGLATNHRAVPQASEAVGLADQLIAELNKPVIEALRTSSKSG